MMTEMAHGAELAAQEREGWLSRVDPLTARSLKARLLSIAALLAPPSPHPSFVKILFFPPLPLVRRLLRYPRRVRLGAPPLRRPRRRPLRPLPLGHRPHPPRPPGGGP